MSDIIPIILSPTAVKRQLSGVILSRFMFRGLLELEAAQLVNISPEAEKAVVSAVPAAGAMALADTAQPALILLFSGENAAAKAAAIVDNINFSFGRNLVCAPEEAACLMKVLSKICAINNLTAAAPADGEERTLLIIKPENFRQPSCRPGAIIDMLMSLELKWVGCKVHGMSVDEALEFYGPVRPALRKKLGPKIGTKALNAIEEKFNIKLSDEDAESLIKAAGNGYADDEFERLVEFMAGKRPGTVSAEESGKPAGAKCMVLIFDGADAVAKIRRVLGPTNPAEAAGGTVRYDFGTNIMVNAAHASDCVESYARESAIVKVNENRLSEIAAEYR